MTVVTDEVFCKSQEPATKTAKRLNGKSFKDLKLLRFNSRNMQNIKFSVSLQLYRLCFLSWEMNASSLKRKENGTRMGQKQIGTPTKPGDLRWHGSLLFPPLGLFKNKKWYLSESVKNNKKKSLQGSRVLVPPGDLGEEKKKFIYWVNTLLLHCIKLKSEERTLLNSSSVLRAGGRKIRTLLQKHLEGELRGCIAVYLFLKCFLSNSKHK